VANVLARDDRVGDVQGQGDYTGEDQQSAGWLQLCCRSTRESQVPGAKDQGVDLFGPAGSLLP
jgi:hypothetical protein